MASSTTAVSGMAMKSVVMRPAAVCSPNSSSCDDLPPLVRLHLPEDLSGAIFGEVAEQVGRGIGIHFLDDVGGAIGVERLDDRHLDLRIELFQRLGGDFLVDRFEHRFALGRGQVLDDVGDVRRMHLRETLVLDLQLDAARRVGLEEIDEVPRDDARRNPLEQRPQRERRHHALGETPNGAARADVDGQDVQQQVAVDRRRIDLDVVHAHDLPAVHVDDLLIEQVALEQEDAVRRRDSAPRCRRR